MRWPGAWGLALALACDDGAIVIGLPVPDAGVRGGAMGAPPRLPAEQFGDDASWVFDDDAVREYQLVLTPENWEALKASALAEAYFPAELRVDGAPFGVVGLRFKGSRGTLGRCATASGHLRCSKLSMKLKFDEYADDQRFFGLKRLNFNSMLSDSTVLHERLAYQLFREMGVAAPRAVHARLNVNGQELGLFSLVEQIDGRFTDDRFAGGDGNLYKEQWPITGSSSALDATLKTNEKVADHALLAQFHSELAAAAPEARIDVVSRYMAVDELLAYVAVDRITNNWDGVSGFYCRGRGCYNHNFYLYQHEHEPRFSVVPWDLDNTFRLWTAFEQVPMPLAVPEDCSKRYSIFGSVLAKAPGCDSVFYALAQLDRERYRDTLRRLLAGPFDFGRLDAWLDARLEQLAPYVEREDNGLSLAYFQGAVETLRRNLRVLAVRALAEQDGAPLPHDRLAIDALNDFEASTPLGLQLAVDPHFAGGSRVMAALAEGAALSGQKDVAISFEFPARADEERWVRMRLLLGNLGSGAADLSAKASLSLDVKADAPRSVRIGIDSDLYSQYASRAVFGWDVELDGSHQHLELALADTSYPAWGADTITRQEALSQSTALLIEPRVVEPKDRGLERSQERDVGKIAVDRISFTP